MVLPILGICTIHGFVKDNTTDLFQCGKDSYYRILSNQLINWRDFLFQFVKQYLRKDELFTQSENQTKCLIFDDTDLYKTGKKIEGLSKIYDHVSNSFFFGFKLLVAGYWNGSVFIPVDFSFHRESKTSKLKYGLTAKQRKLQRKVSRDTKTHAYKRFQELNQKKIDVLIKMFSRIVRHKIPVDYILMDSWFTSVGLIKKLKKINPNTQVIGAYKYNSVLEMESKTVKISELKKQKKKPKRCRKLNYYYHRYVAKIDEVECVVFISKRGVNGKWHTIISTDVKLSFIEAIELYSIRWTIEVFFKEVKQLFGLGKCQSTNFDVHVAQTTLTMVQYLLTSIRFRMEAYESIGGLFKDLKQDYIKNKLNIRILAIVNLIIGCLEKIIDSIDVQSITRSILREIENFGFLSSNQKFSYQGIN